MAGGVANAATQALWDFSSLLGIAHKVMQSEVGSPENATGVQTASAKGSKQGSSSVVVDIDGSKWRADEDEREPGERGNGRSNRIDFGNTVVNTQDADDRFNPVQGNPEDKLSEKANKPIRPSESAPLPNVDASMFGSSSNGQRGGDGGGGGGAGTLGVATPEAQEPTSSGFGAPGESFAAMSMSSTPSNTPTPLSNEQLVNVTTNGTQTTSAESGRSVASAGDGSYWTTWTSPQSSSSGGFETFARRFSAAGVAITGEIRVNTVTSGEQKQPTIASDSAGNAIVTWQSNGSGCDGWDVKAQRLSSSGAKLGNEFRVNNSTDGDHRFASAAFLDDGGFVIVYTAENCGNQGIWFRRYNAAGVAQGNAVLVEDGGLYGTVAGVPGGGFAIAYLDEGQCDERNVYLKRFSSSTGASIGSRIRVDQNARAAEASPEIAVSKSGQIAVTWEAKARWGCTEGAYLRLFSSTGAATTNEILVADFSNSSGGDPSVSYLNDNSLTVVWTGKGQADSKGIFAKTYSNAGVATSSSSFLINQTTSGEQQYATVARTLTGFIVAWSGKGIGDSNGIFCRRFASAQPNQAPVLAAIGNKTVNEHAPLTFTASASDPDYGQTIAYSLDAGAPAGASINSVTGAFTWTPGETAGGNVYTVTIRATDNGSPALSDAETITITVNEVNSAPVAASDSYTVSEDGVLTVTAAAAGLLANDSDQDGDNLTASLVAGPGKGSVSLAANGTFTYTPFANQSGVDTFSYRSFDGVAYSNTATVTVNITAVNDAPVAQNHSYTIAEDGTLVVPVPGVLAGATDVDSTNLTAVLVSSPASGAFALNANGSFSYSPPANVSGQSFSFTYRIFDGQSYSNIATAAINVTAVNDAPVAQNDSFTTAEDTPLVVAASAILSNDADIENSSLSIEILSVAGGTFAPNDDGTYTFTPTPDFAGVAIVSYRVSDGELSSDPATIAITVTPVNDAPIAHDDDYQASEDGMLSVPFAAGLLANDVDIDSPNLTITVISGPSFGLLAVNPDGSFDYLSDINFEGVDSFQYVISDGEFLSNVATVTIHVAGVNDAPTAGDDSFSTAEDTPLVISAASLKANDGDVDGDALAIEIIDATNGTFVDNNDGTFTFTPAGDFFGAATIRYRLSDGELSSNIATVTIDVTPVNDAPTLTAAPVYTLAEDGSLVTTEADGIKSYAFDAEGDALSVVLVGGPDHGALNLASDGSFTYSPDPDFFGVDSFQVRISDGLAESEIVTVTLNVQAVNDAPVSASDAYAAVTNVVLVVGAAAGVLANDHDIDGPATLSAVLVADGEHGHVVLAPDGSFVYTPENGFYGIDSFSYRVSDNNLEGATTVVTIDVVRPNTAPTVSSRDYSVSQGETLLVDAVSGLLSGTADDDGDSLAIIILSQPQHGSFVWQNDGSFEYVADPTFVGVDSFTFAVSDGLATSAAATVTLLVTNYRPVVENVDYYLGQNQVFEVGAAQGALQLAYDPEGKPLTAVLVSGPEHGSLVLNADGSFIYTPDSLYAGDDCFVLLASDSVNDSSLYTVSLHVAADPSIAGGYGLQSTPSLELDVAGAPVAVAAADIDLDGYQDLLTLASDSRLTVAYGSLDGAWRETRTIDLGVGTAYAMESVILFDGDPYRDLIILGPDGISVFAGDADGGFTLRQSVLAGALDQITPPEPGANTMVVAALNDDYFVDVAILSSSTDEVLLFQGTSGGLFADPVAYSAGIGSTALIAGDFIGDARSDLAIGHADGTLTFLKGVAGGFIEETGATVSGLGAIVALAAADFDADGDLDIAVSGTDQASVLFKNADPAITELFANGDFSVGLSGWTASDTVHVGAGMAVISESGDSLLSTLQRTFVVPAGPQTIGFDITGLELDSVLAGDVPDAFEVSLLDQDDNSVVATIAADATSFFNVNPDGTVRTASGVTFVNGRVTLDISGLAAGTTVTIYFDIVGNPAEQGSKVSIDNVTLTPSTLYHDTFAQVALTGVFGETAGIVAGDLNGDGYLDVAIADAGSGEIEVFSGDGAGGFIANTPLPVAAGEPIALAKGTFALPGGFTQESLIATVPDAGIVLTPVHIDHECDSTQFFVVDASDSVYRYANDGDGSGDFAIDTNLNAKGIAASLDGGRLWTVDAAGTITVTGPNGRVLGTWQASDVIAAEDITTDGQTIYILDAGAGLVRAYGYGAFRNQGTVTADSAFALDAANGSATGLWTDGNGTFWATDDGSDAVYIYSGVGELLGVRALDAAHADVSGITGDQDGNLWTVDRATARVYAYVDGQSAYSGALTAASWFQLDVANGSPEGIADPTPLPDPSGLPTITFGTTVSGSIATAAEEDGYKFTGTAGQWLYLDSITGNGNFRWQLFSPAGTPLLSNVNYADVDTFQIPSNGTYQLFLYSSGTTTGSYSFRVLNVNAPSTNPNPVVLTTDPGNLHVVSGTTTLGQIESYTVDLVAGQRYAVDAWNTAIPMGVNNNTPVFMSLIRPDGTVQRALSTDDIGAFTATQTGTYKLKFSSYADANHIATGSYSFVVANPVIAAPQSFNIGDVVGGSILLAGEEDRFIFHATAGQKLFFDSQLQGAISFGLLRPNGTIFQIGGSNEGVGDKSNFIIPETGDYTVFGHWSNGVNWGTSPYQFKIWEVAPDKNFVLPLNTTVTGTIDTPGQSVFYTFTAQAGQEYWQDIRSNPNSLQLTIISPTGQTINPTPTSTSTVGKWTASVTGTYTLRLANVGGNGVFSDKYGSIDFRMQQASAGDPGVADSSGTDYWFGFLGLGADGAFGTLTNAVTAIGITGDVATTGTLLINNMAFTFDVTPGQTTYISTQNWAALFPSNNEMFGTLFARLRTLAEVTVVGYSTVEALQEAFLVLPVDSLGTDYYVAAIGGGESTGSRKRGSEVGILATENGTTVTITPSVTVGSRTAGVPYTISLSQGQTYLLNALSMADLTGTHVVSNKPIMVTSGHLIANVPFGTNFANTLVEQIPPVKTWGNHFLAVPFATRLNGDILRVIASEAGTQVRINGSLVATLGAGQFYETSLTTASEIITSKPALAYQISRSTNFDGVTGDPSMSILPPAEQYLNHYTYQTALNFISQNYVNLTVPEAGVGTITIDGVLVSASLFHEIGSSGWYSAQIAVGTGTHVLDGATNFGAVAYGFGPADAYSMPLGFSLAPIHNIGGVTIAPASANLTVGGQYAAVATVVDTLGNAMKGVSVNFLVDGANVVGGSGVTDALGRAYFVYTGSNNGNDVVTATAGAFDATASVQWLVGAPLLAVADPTAGTPAGTGNAYTGSTVLFTGSAFAQGIGNTIVDVTINGQAVDAFDAAGNIFTTAAIQAGTNYFDFTATDAYGQVDQKVITIQGIARPAPSILAGSELDVSSKAQIHFANTTFNRKTNVVYADSSIENLTNAALNGPLVAAFSGFDPTSVTIGNPDGTDAGRPLVSFDSELDANQTLAAHATSTAVHLAFANPVRDRFDFDVQFLAGSTNTAPAITSAPAVSAFVGRAYSYDANAVDPENQTLAWSLVSAPAGMSINAVTGVIGWTPASTDVGAHLVSIQVSDGRGGVATQSFTLSVAVATNTSPVFTSAPIVAVDPAAAYDYMPNVFDPDNDTLSYFLDNAPPGVTFSSSTGAIHWDSAVAGNYQVTLRVTDGHGGVATQQFVLAVGQPYANGAPIITSGAPGSVAFADRLYVFHFEATDPQGDPLTWSLPQAPANASIDSTGRLTWTPAIGDLGIHSITARVSDGLGGVATQTFLLEVRDVLANLAPAFSTQPPKIATVNASYSFAAVASDPEGDGITYFLATKPEGMDIDSSTGVLTWTPDINDIGFHLVAIKATDPQGASAYLTYFVDVRPTNVAPLFTTTPIIEIERGESYRYDADATDTADAVTYSLFTGPSGMFVDAGTGIVSWNSTGFPLGDQPIVIRATDARGLSTDQSYTLAVVADTTAPEVELQLSTYVTDHGETVVATVQAVDNVGVTSITLVVNGAAPVTLLSGQSYSFAADQFGLMNIVATARDAAGNSSSATAALKVQDPDDVTAPTVDIAAPPTGDIVTYLTEILGSVTDEHLESWQLQYSVHFANDWTTIASGTTDVSTATLLGVFDPTLLQNNIYDIRLIATDFNGQQATDSITLNVTANAKIGVNEFTGQTFEMHLGGAELHFDLSYSTMYANQSGDFGYGWHSCLIEPNVIETTPISTFESLLGMFAAVPLKSGDRVYVTTPDCQRVGFTFLPKPHDGIWNLVADQVYEPRFVADPGVDWELYGETDFLALDGYGGSFNLNGFPTPLQRTANGEFVLAYLAVQYNPLGYQLISKEGTRYHISQTEGLKEIVDRNGNTLTVTEAGIIDQHGEGIQFQRDDQGRITRVIDQAGAEFIYHYNEAGELDRVETPDGLSNEYKYNGGPEHFLTTINEVNPNPATPELKFTYSIGGRLTGIVDATLHTTRQEFDLINRIQTTYDPLDNAFYAFYDDRGNVIKQINPMGGIVTITYDAEDNETSIIDERGYTTSFTYDDRGNMLTMIDALGYTTSSTFDEHNNITSQTDAFGNIFDYSYDDFGNLLKIYAPLDTTIVMSYDDHGNLISLTDANNYTTHLEYDHGHGTPKTIRNPDGTVIEIEYHSNGHVETYKDENGNSSKIEYDQSGTRVLSATDSSGHVVLFAYAANRLDRMTNKRGYQTALLYDAAGRVVRETDSNGSSTIFSYDAAGRKTAEQDKNGNVKEFEYDKSGRMTLLRNPVGNETRYEYDAAGNQTAIVDGNGNRTEMTYDKRNYLISRKDALDNEWIYGYDAGGNRTSSTDPNGNTTTFEYDNLQRLVHTISGAGVETFNTYDLVGNLVSYIDANGHATEYEYDKRNRLITQTDSIDGITSYTYDGVGNRASVTDELGRTTSYIYDEMNRVVSMTDAAGKLWTYAYNEVDKLNSATDPLGNTTVYEYDTLDRLVTVIDANGHKTRYEYDAVGNRTKSIDALERTTTYTYDDTNRLIAQLDPSGSLTTYAYDATGNQTSITDPNDNTTYFVYDDANRLIEQTNPLNHTAYFTYDAVGNLIESVDRNGRTRQFAYDEKNRVVSETWIDGSTIVNELTYAYDLSGNLLSASDYFSSYTYTYDALNRMTSVDNAGTPDVPRLALNYAYDAVGNVTSVTDNFGVQVASTYDVRNQLTSRTWSGANIDPARIDFAYDDSGRRTTATRYANLAGTAAVSRSLYEYDAKGLISGITHVDSLDAVLAEYDYTRNLADEIVQWTHHGETVNFQYDNFGQLTAADYLLQTDESYTYDANGNRISGSNVIGPNNQLLSDGTFTYSYDAEGNLVLKTNIATGEKTEYEYDFRNRLIRVTEMSAGGIILKESDYRYDLFNRRIATAVDLDGAGVQEAVTTFTLYNGDNAWADFSATGEVLARYLFGDRADEILARFIPGQGTAWYLTDHLGTVRDIINASGQLINHIDYDSFGRVLAQTNAAAGDRFLFTGRELDAATGMYYYRARFYDPTNGRFVSQDPIAFAAGDVNLYRYVANNPASYTDPTGHLALSERAVLVISAAIDLTCAFVETFFEKKDADWGDYVIAGIFYAGTTLLGFAGAGLVSKLLLKWAIAGKICAIGLTSIAAAAAFYGIADAAIVKANWPLLLTRSFCLGLNFLSIKGLLRAFRTRVQPDLPTARPKLTDAYFTNPRFEEVPISKIKQAHAVPRDDVPDDWLEDALSKIREKGIDTGRAIKMPDGTYVAIGGNHRNEAMKAIGESTQPMDVVDWNTIPSDYQNMLRNVFPDAFGE